ncbi:amino acid ABC transporter substrate-binding protein [Tychonema sp. LEGE 07203]|uniref:amino acid ABC transporter substrate-binding protein n=1 Tax=Tychonema sp. LEGE 07203 TaxID=1828671 RepID=UPI0018825A14|nr:amino acid ABC transporter substrate-binding protein [Tychonema sp. LEGE 07203]
MTDKKHTNNSLKFVAIGFVFSIFFPAALPAVASARTALQEIRETGILKVGIRKDAAPFGYLEGENWQGVCIEGLELFRADLEKKLNRSVRLEKLETDLNESAEKGRFRSVASQRAHLECGPNTILQNPPSGIAYSLPFLYSGTYLLVKPENKLRVNPSGFLQGATIGVLSGSLTEQFIAGRYQLANQKIYEGIAGRESGVTDAAAGKIDAFASDGMLLVGEALRQGLTPSQYSLIPEQPLTCISYGMILPAGDTEWQETVNNFIRNQSSTNLLEKVFGPNSPFLPMSVADQNKCI